jgi:hypothetical protein
MVPGTWGTVDNRDVHLESTLERLSRSVESLQLRVAALEAAMQAGVGPATADLVDEAPSPPRPRRDPYDPISMLSLTGRLFLVLAGGFFLRAMTEAGVIAPAAGVVLAFVYAGVWLYLADRAAGRGQAPGAVFHALGAALVAFPLLVEASTRFQVLGVEGSASGLVLLTAAFLLVAVRRRLHGVVWITVAAAIPTALVLLLKTGAAGPFSLYLIALGVVTMWLAYAYHWTAVRWPVALAADLAVSGMTMRALSPAYADQLQVVMLLQVVLAGAYLTSIAVRTLLRDHNVTLFEVTQAALVLIVGFGGAIFLTRTTATLPLLMGAASILFGAACYALAFWFVGRHEGHERNVHFYSSLALVLVLTGLALVMRDASLAGASAVLAVAAAAGWARFARLYFLLHGVVYLLVASIASSAIGYSVQAIFVSPQTWTLPTGAMTLALMAAAFAAWFCARRPRPEGGVAASIARVVVVVVLVVLAGGLLTGLLAPLLARSTDGGIDLGVLATVRTGVLAIVTLLIAWGARQDRFCEWAWLVYPLLVIVGLKMVVQDFRDSRPATLFIALALYGIALIVAPRLRRMLDRGGGHGTGRGQPAQAT